MQNREQILAMLTTILVDEFEIEAEAITPEANLYEELDLDSIDAVDLVIKLQQLTGKRSNLMNLNPFAQSTMLNAIEGLVKD